MKQRLFKVQDIEKAATNDKLENSICYGSV